MVHTMIVPRDPAAHRGGSRPQARLRQSWVALVLILTCGFTTSCTSTAPSGQPAVDALVRAYDQRTGIWPTTGWWNSANAVTALTDHMLVTGDERYVWVLANTFDRKRSAAYGNFTNYLIDDTGWWALAWIRAYDLTQEQRYLTTAQIAADFMWEHHDDVCGGGLWWSTTRQYKNAVTNELYVKVAAELDVRLGGGTKYLDQALSVWTWFEQTGMINDELLVNDGLDDSCTNNGDVAWTYNQGVVLGALVALHEATGDASYLDRARELADVSTTSPALHVDGVLTEVCEQDGCGIDGPSFKGIYVRNLGELDRALPDHPYRDYLIEQATTVQENNRIDGDRYGLHWAGPVDFANSATQASVVDLFTAAYVPPNEDSAEDTAAEDTAADTPVPTETPTGSTAGDLVTGPSSATPTGG